MRRQPLPAYCTTSFCFLPSSLLFRLVSFHLPSLSIRFFLNFLFVCLILYLRVEIVSKNLLL